MGPDFAEAQRTYLRAREAGMSRTQAMVLGQAGSRKDLWAFARQIARHTDCSVRTVQRAFALGGALGLSRTARGKKDEVPPGANQPIPCGWSHRWIVGRGLGGAMREAAINKDRARWMTNFVARQNKPSELVTYAQRAKSPEPRRRPPPGMSTAEWLERELAELAERKSRDGPA